MAAKFDLTDNGLVVIVGSGAGGGTLGHELARKGIKSVILEAGPRYEMEDFVNDEWESFAQLAWTDMRTTSGNWRVARDFPNLPAWIVKAVGGTTVHWAGASLRFQEHEFKSKTVYGNVKGANLLDWPLTARARKSGDRMRPRGGRGSRKLSDLMIDARIARGARAGLPVVTSARGELLFVPGLRPAEIARPTTRTRRLVRIDFEPVNI